MNLQINRFCFLLLCSFVMLCKPATTVAQGFSYVYIQGDKKTPIYTKAEGVMMPRFGKNYALLSRLAPGPLNVEILFQQNEYPALNFIILVPENGKRAFVLNNKNGEFSLYDVQQNFYLKPNNDIADDHMPTVLSSTSVMAGIEKTKPLKSSFETTTTASELPFKDSVANKIADEAVQQKDTPTLAVDNTKQQFIPNITFDNDAAIKETTSTINEALNTKNGSVNDSQMITNSDCSGTVNILSFQKLLNALEAKKTENERLGLIQNGIKQYCFSTLQAQKLVEQLETDPAKISALKDMYPKITDQSNFAALESLITDEDWKNYFKGIVNLKNK